MEEVESSNLSRSTKCDLQSSKRPRDVCPLFRAPVGLTADEYCSLPDAVGYKDELIEGERVPAPMPKFQHTVVLDNLEALSGKQFPDKRVIREAGWRFTSSEGLDSVPGPDLMVVEASEYQRAARSDRYFEGTPLLVIEVVSPCERRSQRLQKIGLYLEAGVSAVVEVDYLKRILLALMSPLRGRSVIASSGHLWPI